MAVPSVSPNARYTVPLAALPGQSSTHSTNLESVEGLGTGIQRTGCSIESWVFSRCCAFSGTAGHAPGVSCLWIHGEWLLWNIHRFQWSWRSRACLQICKCPNKLWLSTPLAAFMWNFLNEGGKLWQPQGTPLQSWWLLFLPNYFPDLSLLVWNLQWWPKHDNSTKKFVEFILISS